MVMAASGIEDDDCVEGNARRSTYLIADQAIEAGSQAFAEAVADAYERHERPRCLCLPDGVEMYIAHLGTGHIVKRMPGSGSRHRPDCPSFEPPPQASGLGQVLGSAITEDPATGQTTLRLDFPLTRVGGHSTMPPGVGVDGGRAASHGSRLSLRGLLHYLWDQAGLTRWQPGFAGRRHWSVVRRCLLQGAQHKFARGTALRNHLYVPELFSVEARDAITARRLAQWQAIVAAPGRPQPLMLLIGEVKEIVPARYGFKAVVKHVPDQAFAIGEPLYRQLGRRFETELALWGAADSIHMVMIATFGINASGIPAIHELCLMPVTRQWLPVEDGFEAQLVERLVSEGRAFVKCLRYNLSARSLLASATLTDCDGPARVLLVVQAGAEDDGRLRQMADPSTPLWVWHSSSDLMPTLPLRGRHRTAMGPHGQTDDRCPGHAAQELGQPVEVTDEPRHVRTGPRRPAQPGAGAATPSRHDTAAGVSRSE